MRDVIVPASLPQLWDALESLPESSVFAGGTDLIVKMRNGLLNPASLICLDRIEELKGIACQPDGTIRIGACTTHTQMMTHPGLRRHLPLLVQAVEDLGSPTIRNMGTIGGNICSASPAGDTLPPLYVLRAEVELCRKNGLRRMPIGEFILGPGQNLLARDEILSAVWIKKPEGCNVHHFEKVGQRNALACSIASLAALLRISADGVVERAALAWGSVAPTIFMCPEAERALIGRPLSYEKLREPAAIVRDRVQPISDLRADADYRRSVSGHLLFRLLKWTPSGALAATAADSLL